MATSSIVPPLVVIVGPTASGKTRLAIELAEALHGEIICADSRTIYKDMNIGTAKPSRDDQIRIPHWGLDLVEPGEKYTVADFQKYARQKIQEIRDKGHIPFLVGGTGLYIDAIVFAYEFGSPPDDNFRLQLEQMTLDELYEYCVKSNIKLPENNKNKRYVIRAIEQNGINTSRKKTPIDNSIIVGITTDKVQLRQRIVARAEQLFDDGVVDEATMLGKKYGWENAAMTGNIYPIIHSYLLNEITEREMKDKNTTQDWQLAKRQLTWLKRNPYIDWYELPEAKQYLLARLVSEQ